jgi:ribonucleoside-diphosphate reductase alpha chain
MGLFTSSERARALETGEYTQDASADIPKAVAPVAAPVAAAPKAVEVKIEPAPLDRAIGSSSDLLESMGIKSDAPLCMTCGVKMRMSGACFVCEGCGNTSGCS